MPPVELSTDLLGETSRVALGSKVNWAVGGSDDGMVRVLDASREGAAGAEAGPRGCGSIDCLRVAQCGSGSTTTMVGLAIGPRSLADKPVFSPSRSRPDFCDSLR